LSEAFDSSASLLLRHTQQRAEGRVCAGEYLLGRKHSEESWVTRAEWCYGGQTLINPKPCGGNGNTGVTFPLSSRDLGLFRGLWCAAQQQG